MTELGTKRRQEQYESLLKLSDRDLCEMVRAHFVSHPCLPGEKAFRDSVNLRLAINDSDSFLSQEEKENYAKAFADTRIREMRLTSSDLDMKDIRDAWSRQESDSMTRSFPVELLSTPSGNVRISFPTEGTMLLNVADHRKVGYGQPAPHNHRTVLD